MKYVDSGALSTFIKVLFNRMTKKCLKIIYKPFCIYDINYKMGNKINVSNNKKKTNKNIHNLNRP